MLFWSNIFQFFTLKLKAYDFLKSLVIRKTKYNNSTPLAHQRRGIRMGIANKHTEAIINLTLEVGNKLSTEESL